MPGYSLTPVTHDYAVQTAGKAMQRGKFVLFFTLIAGLAAAVALGYLVDDITARPAWIALLIAGVICAGATVWSRHIMSGVRYRIGIPFGPLVLVGAVAAFLAVWAVVAFVLETIGGDGSPLESVNRWLLIVGLIAVPTRYLTVSNRFTGNAFTLMVRQTRVPWTSVGAVVFTAGSKPGTIEIGVRSNGPTGTSSLKTRKGELLTDLPYRVVVTQRSFDLDRLHWALNQSGRADIPLIERTPMGERVVLRSNQELAYRP
ncbi:hypothetical protein ACLQ3C_16220 [Gordonia sp. DT30]|uniref:hypothetical protein n=1 Tax=Gordonia sp. DT30 TaxID=3416546 RepID=UPI003CE6C975